MCKVLAPSLELLGRSTNLFAKPCERLSETVRREVGQPGLHERRFENLSDRSSRAPMLSTQSCHLELVIRVEGNLGRREEWVV